MDILEQCHSRLNGWLSSCMAYYTHVVLASTLCYLFAIIWYILLCFSPLRWSSIEKISLSISCRSVSNGNKRRRQTRRIRVIKLHDIYVDSEACKGWIFNYRKFVIFMTTQDKWINWNSIFSNFNFHLYAILNSMKSWIHSTMLLINSYSNSMRFLILIVGQKKTQTINKISFFTFL